MQCGLLLPRMASFPRICLSSTPSPSVRMNHGVRPAPAWIFSGSALSGPTGREIRSQKAGMEASLPRQDRCQRRKRREKERAEQALNSSPSERDRYIGDPLTSPVLGPHSLGPHTRCFPTQAGQAPRQPQLLPREPLGTPPPPRAESNERGGSLGLKPSLRSGIGTLKQPRLFHNLLRKPFQTLEFSVVQIRHPDAGLYRRGLPCCWRAANRKFQGAYLSHGRVCCSATCGPTFIPKLRVLLSLSF